MLKSGTQWPGAPVIGTHYPGAVPYKPQSKSKTYGKSAPVRVPKAIVTPSDKCFEGAFAQKQICHDFLAQGWCYKGVACAYSHDTTELYPYMATAYMAAQACVGEGGWLPPSMATSTETLVDNVDAPSISTHLNANAPAFVPLCPQSTTLSASAPPFAPPFASLQIEGTMDGDEEIPVAAREDLGPRYLETVEEEPVSPVSPGKKRGAPPPIRTEAEGTSLEAKVTVPSASPVSAALRPLYPPGSPLHRPVPLPSPKVDHCTPRTLRTLSGGIYPPPQSLPQTPKGGPCPYPPAVTPGGGPNVFQSGPLPPMMSPSAVPVMPFSSLSPRDIPPIPRSVMLQGRIAAIRLEQGPPGLGQFCPTPTSLAKNVGFRYPEPGWISAVPKTIATFSPT